MSAEELNTYRLQLQQVEAALTTDPSNQELVQLKGDLEQVISLTLELVNQGGGGEQAGSSHHNVDDEEEEEEEQYSEKKSKKSRWTESEPVLPVKPWQVGETCEAVYTGDSHNQYREAVIEEITADGEVTLRFKAYQGTVLTTLSALKLPSSGATTVHAVKSSKKVLLQKQKEYLKEKKKKKLEKMKEMEAMREKEKHKWQNFSTKAFGKKGFVKKSIFKTPESADGKVGVGTCGISGQGMTDFSQATKYRKTF